MTRADQARALKAADPTLRHIWRAPLNTHCGSVYDHDRAVVMPHLSTCVACQHAYAAEVYAEQAGKTTPAQFARDTRVTCPLLTESAIAKLTGTSRAAVYSALRASPKIGRPQKPRCHACGR